MNSTKAISDSDDLVAELRRELADAHAEIAELRQGIASCVGKAERGWNNPDHACRECVGEGPLVIPDFQCARHRYGSEDNKKA